MMEVALYLLPVTLGETPVENVLPVYNKEVILGIKHFIVEDVRSARRFLKKVDRGIDIDALTFYPLNKHTSPEDISGYLNQLTTHGTLLTDVGSIRANVTMHSDTLTHLRSYSGKIISPELQLGTLLNQERHWEAQHST